MFYGYDVNIGEDGNAVVVAKLSLGYEIACGNFVEDVGGLRFGIKFARFFKVARKVGFMTLPLAT